MAEQQPVRIQLCGHLAVTWRGRRIEHDLPGRQGRLLFAYLALGRDRHFTREELVDAVWPQAPPSAPGIAVSALVSKLRNVLGPEAIAGRLPDEVRLVPPPGTWVDAEAAVDAAHRAESALNAGDLARAYAQGHVGMYIARRRFLPGHEGPWVEERRRELEDVGVRATECCIAAQLRLGGSELPIAERQARRLIDAAPYRESAYRLLMDALEARGNLAEALRVYDRLRCLLRDELGAAPGPAVQEAHERLLRRGVGG